MDENSTQTLKHYFREYYFKFGSQIKAPTGMESREFGYFPFGGAMIRHLSFKDIGALRATLVREAPAGVYCSNSLYREPKAEMHLKGWLRAELIFDIDADALNLPCKRIHDVWLCKSCGKREFGLRPETCPACKGNRLLEMSWTCPNCMEQAKRETYRLLEILEGDFGISSSQLRVFFSGNAGYHLGVENSEYELLDTHGRAEIADYLTGRGFSPAIFNFSRLSPNDPGWRGRIARHIRDIPAGQQPFKLEAFEKRIGELINAIPMPEVEKFLERALAENSVRIDSMVTSDIHRIFRMPETLNNKTGLVKKECTRNLDSFNPSVDAIAIEDPKEEVEVSIDISPKIDLGGSSYGPFEAAQVKVPLYVAVYLLAKGAAKLAGSEAKDSQELKEKLKAQVSRN